MCPFWNCISMLACFECHWLNYGFWRKLCWLCLYMFDSRKMVISLVIWPIVLILLSFLYDILTFFSIIDSLIVMLVPSMFSAIILSSKISFHPIFDSLTHQRIRYSSFNIGNFIGPMLIIIGKLLEKPSSLDFRLIMKPSILFFTTRTKIIIALR